MKQFLYNILIKPRSTDVDSQRREYILNILLVGTLILAGAAFIKAMIDILNMNGDYQGIGQYVVGGAFIFFLMLFILSRRRYHTIAASLFIGVYFLLATYTLYQWSIIIPQGVLIYALVIVMAGILLGTNIALLASLIIASTLLTLAYLQTHGYTQPDLSWTHYPSTMGDAIILLFTLIIIYIVSALGNREIERSLARAQHSEHQLRLERDHLEITVEERTRELREAQMEKMAHLYRFAEFGRLASGLFHDLANPLTSVALKLEELSGNERSRVLDQAIEGTKRMENFIQAARKQIQQQKYLAVFVLTEEIKQVIDVLKHRASDQQVKIEFEAPKRQVTLYGNPIKFHQLVTNLITNAIDAYDGIPLTRKNRRARIELEAVGKWIVLMVIDWGVGIPKKDFGRIFEPLYTTKGIDKGTGIGLSIARNIVEEDFEGTIEVQSEEGKGSTFTVKLPVGGR